MIDIGEYLLIENKEEFDELWDSSCDRLNHRRVLDMTYDELKQLSCPLLFKNYDSYDSRFCPDYEWITDSQEFNQAIKYILSKLIKKRSTIQNQIDACTCLLLLD